MNIIERIKEIKFYKPREEMINRYIKDLHVILKNEISNNFHSGFTATIFYNVVVKSIEEFISQHEYCNYHIEKTLVDDIMCFNIISKYTKECLFNCKCYTYDFINIFIDYVINYDSIYS